MGARPFTYPPLGVPKRLADGLWIVDGPVERMRFGPVRLPFPTRMTIAALPTGLWLHSPVALDGRLRDPVAALGAVRWLVAPSWLHYAAIDQWRAAFPEAESWGAAGIEARSAAQGIPVTPERRLGRDPSPWAGEIDQFVLTSRFGDEVAFFHRASRTLILTDLIENFAPERVGLWRWPLRLAGVLGPDGGTPRDYRAAYRDRAALGATVERMLALQPARVILAHGDCYLEDAPQRLRLALAWASKEAA